MRLFDARREREREREEDMGQAEHSTIKGYQYLLRDWLITTAE